MSEGQFANGRVALEPRSLRTTLTYASGSSGSKASKACSTSSAIEVSERMAWSLSLRLIERLTFRFIWTMSSTAGSAGLRFELAVRDLAPDLALVRLELFSGGKVDGLLVGPQDSRVMRYPPSELGS